MRDPSSSLPENRQQLLPLEGPDSSPNSPRGSSQNNDWFSDALSSEEVENDTAPRPHDPPLPRDDPCVLGREEAALVERWALENEAEILRGCSKELLEQRSRSAGLALELTSLMRHVKAILFGIMARIGENRDHDGIFVQGISKTCMAEPEMILVSETKYLQDIIQRLESKLAETSESRDRKVADLEANVFNLTEENRDMASLLRTAILEKEATERNLEKLKKASTGEQKRMAILQLAGRGLQKVGFGFFIGSAYDDSDATEQADESSKCEQGISLADTVEDMSKNLRQQITDLRHSLKESRSDCEHYRGLTAIQAEDIKRSTTLIKDLKERETIMCQIVEDLRLQLSEAREEASRWREACEMEVEAGKFAIGEVEREAAVLREDLERTRAALESANRKVELKEKLAATAAAAEEAAEISLQMADSRSMELRERIEELTKKLEEEAERTRKALARQKIRYMCWPWRPLSMNSTVSNGQSRDYRMMPEMMAILP